MTTLLQSGTFVSKDVIDNRNGIPSLDRSPQTLIFPNFDKSFEEETIVETVSSMKVDSYTCNNGSSDTSLSTVFQQTQVNPPIMSGSEMLQKNDASCPVPKQPISHWNDAQNNEVKTSSFLHSESKGVSSSRQETAQSLHVGVDERCSELRGEMNKSLTLARVQICDFDSPGEKKMSNSLETKKNTPTSNSQIAPQHSYLSSALSFESKNDDTLQFDLDSRSTSFASLTVTDNNNTYSSSHGHDIHPDSNKPTKQIYHLNNTPPAHLHGGKVKCISPHTLQTSHAPKLSSNAPSFNRKEKGKGQAGFVTGPLVYSAIGSLENYNHNSLGSFNHKINAAKAKAKLTHDSQVSLTKTTSKGNQKKHGSGQKKHLSKQSQGIKKSSSASAWLHNPKTSEFEIPLAQQERETSYQAKRGVQITVDTSEKSNIKPKLTKKKDENKDTPTKSKKNKKKSTKRKKVSIDDKPEELQHEQPVEMFRPSCDAYTPRMERKAIKYKPAEQRTSVEKMSTTMGTIQRPNFRDALRRVAMIVQQHIVKIERRFDVGVPGLDNAGLFMPAMRDAFAEDNYVTPRYKCTIVKMPMARPGIVYGMRKIKMRYNIPTAAEIYEFAHQLFKSVKLSSECSIVCLIYVERLMEVAKVPLMANTWRPIFMCGLLLASKVWQDLNSWNIEFACVYPQYSLDSINRLELEFLRMVKWDLYISSSLYAKYYFALRSLLEKQDFRQRYNRMVGGVDNVAVSEALKIQKRSEVVKEEAILQLSRSM